MLSNAYRIHNGYSANGKSLSVIVMFPTCVEIDCFTWRDEMQQCAFGKEIKVGTSVSRTYNQLRTFIAIWGMAKDQIRWYKFTTGTGIIYVKVIHKDGSVYVENADAQDISCMDLTKDGWDANNLESVLESLYDGIVKTEQTCVLLQCLQEFCVPHQCKHKSTLLPVPDRWCKQYS